MESLLGKPCILRHWRQSGGIEATFHRSRCFPRGASLAIIWGLIFHHWRNQMLKRLILAAVPALMLAQPVLAERGDAEAGRVIAYTCTGCHGIPFHQNVYPTYSVPRIGGQTYGYIVSSLMAYRSGERRHPTMQAQANTLSDQDIHDVAAYFVSLTEDSE
jgi:cytochrome c553